MADITKLQDFLLETHRLCDSIIDGCNDCPFADNKCGCPFSNTWSWDTDDTNLAITILEAWSNEHQPKSWKQVVEEGLHKQFPECVIHKVINQSCPHTFFPWANNWGKCDEFGNCEECWNNAYEEAKP